MSGDTELIEAARRTLQTLARFQAVNGQVPSYIIVGPDDEIGEVNYGGLGEVTSIDSSLWFLFACQAVFRHSGDVTFVEHPLFATYREVIRYLRSIDANSCGLLEIPIAGDWTDILNRSYHVLYDQVLWFRALASAAELAEDASRQSDAERYADAAEHVRNRVNADFWWDCAETVERVANKYKIRNALPASPDFGYYQSHLEPFLNNWFERFDAFANVLAALMGIAPPERVDAIIEQVRSRGLDRPFALRVLDPPIEGSDPDAYQLNIADEPPFVYHNGGIWPLAGGFWTVLLAMTGRRQEGERALAALARALKTPDSTGESWSFPEFFHGRTHKALGTREMSWNGAAYILAYHALRYGDYAYFGGRRTDPREQNENEPAEEDARTR